MYVIGCMAVLWEERVRDFFSSQVPFNLIFLYLCTSLHWWESAMLCAAELPFIASLHCEWECMKAHWDVSKTAVVWSDVFAKNYPFPCLHC